MNETADQQIAIGQILEAALAQLQSYLDSLNAAELAAGNGGFTVQWQLSDLTPSADAS
jgi:hypothetical protein